MGYYKDGVLQEGSAPEVPIPEAPKHPSDDGRELEGMDGWARVSYFDYLTNEKPEKALNFGKKACGGRNNRGVITVKGRGGGSLRGGLGRPKPCCARGRVQLYRVGMCGVRIWLCSYREDNLSIIYKPNGADLCLYGEDIQRTPADGSQVDKS